MDRMEESDKGSSVGDEPVGSDWGSEVGSNKGRAAEEMERRLSALEARRSETSNIDGPSVPAPTGHAVSLLEARLCVVEDMVAHQGEWVQQASPPSAEHNLHGRVNELHGLIKALSKRLDCHLEEYKARNEAALRHELSDLSLQRELTASSSASHPLASTE